MKKILCGFGAAAVLAGSAAASNCPATPSGPSRKAPRCSTAPVAVGSARVAYAGVVRRRARVYDAPGRRVVADFDRLNANGFATVFEVLAVRRTRRCLAAWYRVQVPVRPNGTTGWVHAWAVDVQPVSTRIVIHVRARRLELLRAGRLVLSTRISTGAPDTPTPVGRFYVKERLLPANANGPFGPAALGTSAFSPVLKTWAQGGPVGIHGTDDPRAIGRPVSHGCIRLPNAAMLRLFRLTPAGTPVIIVA